MLNLSVPAQQRSKMALERFLNTSAHLLANNEFEQTGVAQIAKLSGSSVGTFYRLFGDKDVLLCAAHDRFVLKSRERVSMLAEQLNASPSSLVDKASDFITGVSDIYNKSEGLIRALIIRSSSDANFRIRIHQLNSHVCETFTHLLTSHEAVLGHPNPGQAADLCAHMLLASLNYLSMVGTLGSTPREAIPRELSRLICSYLQAQPTSAVAASSDQRKA